MKNKSDELNDDDLGASYEAFKALLGTGMTKAQALSRTGLTAQMVKDYEADLVEGDDDDAEEEEDDMGYDEEATEEWDAKEEGDDFEDDSKWEEEDVDSDSYDDDAESEEGGFDDGF